MRIMKAREYEIGKECTVSSPAGYLVVKLIESFPLGAFLFEWRFESDTAWARVDVSPEEDVIDEIQDRASDIYRRTGQRKQAPDHPQYAAEAKAGLLANLCRYCGNVHEIQTALFQGGTLTSCPMVPRDRFVAIAPRSEPEPLTVKYDGDPLTAAVKIGEHPAATEWAFQWANDRSVKTGLTVTPEGWVFYDEVQKMPAPCAGVGLHVYATGAVAPVTFECVVCGELWTRRQLDAGHAPFHWRNPRGERRDLRHSRRKIKMARKRRRGW